MPTGRCAMPMKKNSTAAPPYAPRISRPSLLFARIGTRVHARPHAARPIRKRMNAICGPGRRAAATFVASAMAANTSAAKTSEIACSEARLRRAELIAGGGGALSGSRTRLPAYATGLLLLLRLARGGGLRGLGRRRLGGGLGFAAGAARVLRLPQP